MTEDNNVIKIISYVDYHNNDNESYSNDADNAESSNKNYKDDNKDHVRKKTLTEYN